MLTFYKIVFWFIFVIVFFRNSCDVYETCTSVPIFKTYYSPSGKYCVSKISIHTYDSFIDDYPKWKCYIILGDKKIIPPFFEFKKHIYLNRCRVRIEWESDDKLIITRPIYKKIYETRRTFYKRQLSKDFKIEFKIIEYDEKGHIIDNRSKE